MKCKICGYVINPNDVVCSGCDNEVTTLKEQNNIIYIESNNQIEDKIEEIPQKEILDSEPINEEPKVGETTETEEYVPVETIEPSFEFNTPEAINEEPKVEVATETEEYVPVETVEPSFEFNSPKAIEEEPKVEEINQVGDIEIIEPNFEVDSTVETAFGEVPDTIETANSLENNEINVENIAEPVAITENIDSQDSVAPVVIDSNEKVDEPKKKNNKITIVVLIILLIAIILGIVYFVLFLGR